MAKAPLLIVPSRDIGNLRECLGSLGHYPHSRILVVDDGLDWSKAPDLRETVQVVPGTKPFIYARNINLGLHKAGPSDSVVLLNDDTRLLTGTQSLKDIAKGSPFDIVSASVVGECGNRAQSRVPGGPPWHSALGMVCFIGVYLPPKVLQRVGLLDERFVGYGYEDVDYCRRATEAGFSIGVSNRCTLDHTEPQRSSFRRNPRWEELLNQNYLLFEEKWKGVGQ